MYKGHVSKTKFVFVSNLPLKFSRFSKVPRISGYVTVKVVDELKIIIITNQQIDIFAWGEGKGGGFVWVSTAFESLSPFQFKYIQPRSWDTIYIFLQ